MCTGAANNAIMTGKAELTKWTKETDDVKWNRIQSPAWLCAAGDIGRILAYRGKEV